MRVARWGNSLAVRLPVSVVAALNLKAGDAIEIRVAGKQAMEIAKRPGCAGELLEGLRRYRGRLPDEFRFDRREANARC